MAASDPVTALLNIGGAVIDRLWPDPIKANEAKLELYRLEKSGELEELKATTSLALAQASINAEEAKSSSLFVSGWRPAVGWTCALGLVYTFMGQPILAWGSLAFHIPVPPLLDMGTLITLLGGMLGIGGMRTVEKLQGVARK